MKEPPVLENMSVESSMQTEIRNGDLKTDNKESIDKNVDENAHNGPIHNDCTLKIHEKTVLLSPNTEESIKTGIDNLAFESDTLMANGKSENHKEHNDFNLNQSSIDQKLKDDSDYKTTEEIAEAVNLELLNMGANLTNGLNGIPVKNPNSTVINMSSPYDEYFIPVNEHRKYIRGEKLYVTKNKRDLENSKKNCCVWIAGLVTAMVAICLAILIATKFNQDPLSANERRSQDGNILNAGIGYGSSDPVSNFQNSRTTSSTADFTSEYLKQALEGEFTIDNLTFTPGLADHDSKEFKEVATSVEEELKEALFDHSILTYGSANIYIRVINLTPENVVQYRIGWVFKPGIQNPPDPINVNSLKDKLKEYIRKKQGFLYNYRVPVSKIYSKNMINDCLINNGNCSDSCTFDYEKMLDFFCTCPENFKLDKTQYNCEPITDFTTEIKPELRPESEPTSELEPKSESSATSQREPKSEGESTFEPELSSAQPKSEPESNLQLEPSTELEPKSQSEPSLEAEPKSEPEPKSELESLAEPESKFESKSTLEPKPLIEAKPEYQPKQLAELESKSTPKSSVESESKSEPEPSVESEPKSEPESSAVSESKSESELKSKSESSVVPELNSEPEPSVESEPKSEPEPSAVSEPEPSAVSEPEPSAVSEPELKSKSESSIVPEPNSEPEPSAVSELKSKSESSVVPEPNSESEPSVKSEPKSKPEPLAVSEPKSEPELKSKSESSIVPEPEPSVKSEPKSKPEPLAISEPKSEPELKSKSESSIVPEPNSEPEPSAVSELKSKSESSVVPEPNFESEPSVKSEPEPSAVSEPKSEPELKSKSESSVVPESNSESEPSVKSEPESSAVSEPKSEPELKSKLESSVVPESNSESEPSVKSEPESSAVSEPKSEPELKSKLESSVVPESNSESEPSVKSELEPSAVSEPEPSTVSEPKSKPEPEPESKSKSKPEPESSSEPEVKSELKSSEKSQSELSAEPVPTFQAEPSTKLVPKSEEETTIQTKTKLESELKFLLEPGAKSVSEFTSQSESKSELELTTMIPSSKLESSLETNNDSHASKNVNIIPEYTATTPENTKHSLEIINKANNSKENISMLTNLVLGRNLNGITMKPNVMMNDISIISPENIEDSVIEQVTKATSDQINIDGFSLNTTKKLQNVSNDSALINSVSNAKLDSISAEVTTVSDIRKQPDEEEKVEGKISTDETILDDLVENTSIPVTKNIKDGVEINLGSAKTDVLNVSAKINETETEESNLKNSNDLNAVENINYGTKVNLNVTDLNVKLNTEANTENIPTSTYDKVSINISDIEKENLSPTDAKVEDINNNIPLTGEVTKSKVSIDVNSELAADAKNVENDNFEQNNSKISEEPKKKISLEINNSSESTESSSLPNEISLDDEKTGNNITLNDQLQKISDSNPHLQPVFDVRLIKNDSNNCDNNTDNKLCNFTNAPVPLIKLNSSLNMDNSLTGNIGLSPKSMFFQFDPAEKTVKLENSDDNANQRINTSKRESLKSDKQEQNAVVTDKKQSSGKELTDSERKSSPLKGEQKKIESRRSIKNRLSLFDFLSALQKTLNTSAH